MLRFLDAGESHGLGVAVIMEGFPYGVPLEAGEVEVELARRRLGYGRSNRMELEKDKVEIISGVRLGKTLGSPVTFMIKNAEYDKWRELMKVEGDEPVKAMTRIRPGHADLAGAIKYGTRDLRDILERASARETVGRVCAGTIAKKLLACLNIFIYSHVLSVGKRGVEGRGKTPSIEEIKKSDDDPMRCLDAVCSGYMREEIDRARDQGDTLGGIFEIVGYGLPCGLGSHVQWDRRLDARLGASVMSIQAIKGVEFGGGFAMAGEKGSEVADQIFHEHGKGFYRSSNHAGGLEGGMTNGEPLVLRAAMKPIPTLGSPCDSVDLVTKEKVTAGVERADICAVPAAAVVAESAVAWVLADALLEKTGGDSLEEIKSRYNTMVRRQTEF
jgi:chorismate synthase